MKLKLRVGGIHGQLLALVMKNLIQKCLLAIGADFLQQNGCVTDIKEQTTIPGEMQPIVCQGKKDLSQKILFIMSHLLKIQ